MKTRVFLSAVALISSLWLGGGFATALAQSQAASPATPTFVLTAKNNGEKLAVNIGDVIAVRLDANLAPGYGWVPSVSSGSAKLLGATNDAASGLYVANFQAERPGLVTVHVEYVRESTPGAPMYAVSYRFDVASPAGASQSVSQNGTRRPRISAVPRAPVVLGLAPAATKNSILLGNGVQYSGGLDADGNPSGPGELAYPDGTVLTSVFVNGAYSGLTTWLEPAGAGGLRNTVVVNVNPPSTSASGPATVTFGDGTKLVGTILDGSFEGPATYTSLAAGGYDESTFVGSFTDGVLQGPFSSIARNGTKTTGTVTNGSTQGPGVLTVRGQQPCTGHISQSGEFYAFSGQVDSEGRPNGRGTSGCPNEELFTGRFSHGKMVGVIVDQALDGTIYRVDVGRVPTDRLIGAARVNLKNGDIAVGRLNGRGTLSGIGTFKAARSTAIQHGRWVNGTLVVYEGTR